MLKSKKRLTMSNKREINIVGRISFAAYVTPNLSVLKNEQTSILCEYRIKIQNLQLINVFKNGG